MRRIKSVTINKLFGYENNNYKVNLIDDGQITFIYAFNGVGKTTLLKLLYAVINQNTEILRSVSFESIILTFNQNEQLIVTKLNDENNQISYELRTPKKLFGYYTFKQVFSLDSLPGVDPKETECEDILQFLGNLETDILFANKDYGRVIRSKDSSFEFYAPYLETDYIPISLSEAKKLIAQKEEEISRDKERIQNIKNKTNKTNKEVVAGLLGVTAGGLALAGAPAGIMSAMVGGVIGTYVSLFNRKRKKKVLDDVSKELDRVKKDIDHEIEKYELLISDSQNYIDIPLPDKINYIQKTLEYKLNDENISKKIDLYEEIINNYNALTDKTLHINRETGELKIQTVFSDSEFLVPKYLSSGEKNLLLLYFHIIFIIPETIKEDETFIELIDEPEVSMHPSWLMNFVESLKYINDNLHRKDNYQYIITTHSPGITFGNSDLMVELERD